MTARQLAQAECANWVDGACSGASAGDDGSQILMSHAGQRCLVARGERCRYFEQCLLPLRCSTTDPRRKRELDQAALQYDAIVNSPSGGKCGICGQPRLAGRSYCPTCARSRRKETARKRQQKRRKRKTGLPVTLL